MSLSEEALATFRGRCVDQLLDELDLPREALDVTPEWQVQAWALYEQNPITWWVDRQLRLLYAREEIIAIMLLAANPWAWGALGFPQWCEERR